jgi:hypothetical protein
MAACFYAKCHLCRVSRMPSVINKPFLLSVDFLNVILQVECLFVL